MLENLNSSARRLGRRAAAAMLVAIVRPAAGCPLRSQTPAALADGALCSLVVDRRDATARGEAMQQAARGGTRGTFFSGCVLFAEGKPGDAAAAFDRAIRGDTANPVWYAWLGRADGEQAQSANVLRQALLARRARAAFERAVELAPGYLDARDALLQFALQAPSVLGGGVDRARAQAAEIARRDPYRGTMALFTIARHEADTTEMQRVEEMLVGQYPDSARFRMPLISILLAQRKWSDAWTAIDQFERAFPDAAPARYAAGRAAAESGQQLDRGESALRSYLTHTPGRGEPTLAGAHYRLGQVLERQSDHTAARHEYEIAISLDSTLIGAKSALARLR